MISSYTARFSYDYYLRNAYSKNREARKSENRTSIFNNTLIIADSSATKKLSEKLGKLDYDTEHSTEIYQTTKAFIETYNNLIQSSGSSDEYSITSLKKHLSKMTKEEKEQLASIGIEIKSNGQLKLDKKTFGECKPSKIAKVFSSDNTFIQSVRSYASRIYKISNRLVSSYDSNGNRTAKKSESGSTVDVSL